MLRGATALALSFATLACQPPVAEADAAEADAAQPDAAQPMVQQATSPEYLNPSARLPFSEGVRYGGLIFENKPARTAVGAALSGSARVEIECIAAA